MIEPVPSSAIIAATAAAACASCNSTVVAAAAIASTHNDPEIPGPVIFENVSNQVVDGLNDGCRVINDWATKKGWNEGVDDPKKIEVNRDIAFLSGAILSLCEEIERVRKGGQTSIPTQLLGSLLKYSYFQFIDKSATPGQLHALAQLGLMHTEVAEASEAIITNKLKDDHVPVLDAVEAELADTVIRIFHYCGDRGIDLGSAVRAKHNFNITRPYRHGKLA